MNPELLEYRLISRKKAKSFWKEDRSQTWAFYCPHCCISRRIRYFPKPGIKHVAQVALTAVFTAMLTYQWLSWKGIVAFAPLWIAFETVYRIKFREALICPHCGFDPHLYEMDVRKARDEVKAFWDRKVERHLSESGPATVQELEAIGEGRKE